MKTNNKEKIKKVALSLFGQKGYEETSLHDIASAVGIKKPSIYNHFAGKEDIFTAVLEDLLITETTAYGELKLRKDEPAENLKRLFDLFCSRLMNTEEALLWKRVTFFPPEPFKDLIEEKFFEFEETITGILHSIYEDAKDFSGMKHFTEPEFTAAFLCLVDGVFLEHHYYREDIFRQRMDASWKVFSFGLFK
ncbi:TetR/AcrR family transcriptional regulator [Rossellomorea aquimaris]|uniref:TetR/AcrR family transcriptional regulator n=1 Tax=Rossellomorea aquimaris TaxID=189382 RepID=UPI001CD32984|nr:TetR/AcrR family transcriptional regulator [Rossellomorea aquimaris]MCA1054441.1 TetR/AcrR family transcriptional regulator [Rossellomorea aquimaris]